MYSYRIGNLKLEGENINELREFSETLGELAKESGSDLPKHLNDACFAIDADYQSYHELDPDEWGMVHQEG